MAMTKHSISVTGCCRNFLKSADTYVLCFAICLPLFLDHIHCVAGCALLKCYFVNSSEMLPCDFLPEISTVKK